VQRPDWKERVYQYVGGSDESPITDRP